MLNIKIRKSLVGLTLLLLLGFAILTALLINLDIHNKVSLFAQLINTAASLGTLLIAYLIYKSFVLDKKLIDKQYDAVISLIESINKMHFGLEYNKDSHIAIFFYRPIPAKSKTPKECAGKNIALSENYMMDLHEKLWADSNNLFLPNIVSEKLKKLHSFAWTYNKILKLDDYVRLFINSSETENIGIPQVNFNKDLTFHDFIARWEDLIETIENWIKENTNEKIPIELIFKTR